MKKTRIRLKTLSVIMVLILLFNAFPAVYAEKDAVGSQVEDVYELPPEEIFPSNGVASPLFEQLSKAPVDSKYKNYTIEKMPEALKADLGVKEGEVVLDITKAEDLYSLTLVSKDGTKKLKVFDEPIKYFNSETETIEFIDNSLTVSEEGENALECTTNSSKAYFPKDINDGIKLNKGKNSVTMTPVNTEVKKNGKVKIKKIKLKKSDCAQYEDVFGEDTLLQYSPTALGIKENIVLEKYNGVNEFNYLIDSGKLVPKENEGTEIIFIDPETEEEVFKIEETFIYDADFDNKDASNNHISFNNHYVIEEQKNGKYLLTTVIDKEFLESEETVYPVVIDPMAEWISEENLFSCFSFSEYDDTQSENLWLGTRDSWVTYVKFLDLNHLTYINPALIEESEFVLTFSEAPETNRMVNFAFPYSNTDEIFYDGTYLPTYESYLEKSNYTTPVQLSTMDVCGIDFKEHLVSYLEIYDEEDGGYYPGFFLTSFFSTPFFEIDNMYITIEYREDNELRDDLYFIKNDTDYLRAVESNGTIYAKWEDLDGESPSKTYNDGYLWYVYSDKLSDLYYIKSYKQFDGNRKHYLCDRENSITVESEITGSDGEKQCWYILKNHDGSYRVINRYIDNTPVDALTKGSSGNLSTSEFRFYSDQKWSFVRYGEREQATTKICTTAEWPTEAATSTINLLKGKTPTVLEYDVSGSMATLGTGTAYPFVGQTNTNGSAMTDGLINGDNVDIRSYTLTQYGENGYIRYINRKDGTYREKGELYLDIVYKLDEIRSIDSLWFATNTQNNDYQVGAFEVYVSQSPETVFFTKNRRATVDKTSGRWSGVACIEFPENVEGDYIGIRITQGVVQKANNEAWPRSELEHAYARIRDIAVFEEHNTVISPSIGIIKSGEVLQLNAIMYPAESVAWISLNQNVATVDENGKVTAIESGVAHILVITENNFFLVRIIVLPSSETLEGDGYVYRILNSSDDKAIQFNSESNAFTTQITDHTNKYQKYKFVYVSEGQYKIIPMWEKSNNKILSNSENGLSIIDDTDNVEAKWYLVPYEEGFLIISAADTSKHLKIESGSYTTFGSNEELLFAWSLKRFELEFSHFYDNGFLSRWNTTESEIEGLYGISYIHNFAKVYFENLSYNGENISLEMSFNGPVKYTSSADECDEGIDESCACDDVDDHKAETTLLEAFNEDHKYSDGSTVKIPVLWTGHLATNREGEIVNNGAANYYQYGRHIMLLNVGTIKDEPYSFDDFALDPCVISSYMHELCHTIGAKDSYCLNDKDINDNCSNVNCATCRPEIGYEKECLMDDYIDWDFPLDTDDWLCDKCLQDIFNYVNGGY